MYLVVEFTDNRELAVVPDNWLDGTSCAVWPPFKSTTKITQSVINKEPPLDSWKAYPIRVLYKHELYEKTRSKLKKAEVESDLQTDGETKDNGRPARHRRSPSRYDSDSSEENIPSAPKRKKTRTGRVGSNNEQVTTICQELPVPPSPIPANSPSPLPPHSPTAVNLSEPLVLPAQQFAQPPPLAPPARQSTQGPLQCVSMNRPTTQASPIQTSVSLSPASTEPLLTPRVRLSTGAPLRRQPVNLFTAVAEPSISLAQQSARGPPQHTSAVYHSPRTPTTSRAPVGTISARDVQFFTLLEKLREEQRHQTSMLSAILAKIGDGAAGDEEIPDLDFPIQDKAAMKIFEERLADKHLEKFVVDHLASIGGSSIANMGERILKYLVANPLAEQYNWTGSKDKDRFEALKIPGLVKRAIRRSFKNVTLADVQAISQKFLKSARDRDGGRKRRMKTTASATESVPQADSDTESSGCE